MEKSLSEKDRLYLLDLARRSIRQAVHHQPLPVWSEEEISPELGQKGASFVTLTLNGDLRGCIGSLEAYQSLIKDIQEHAIQAALEDYRFHPVMADEVDRLHIEISRLTSPESLTYEKPADLPGLLHPGEDGVILKDGFKRATFLPQVWKQLPDRDEFLSHLCVKMGAPSDLWRRKVLEVAIYQVEEFEESY